MELNAVSKVISAAGKHAPVHLTGVKRRIAMIKDIDMDMVRHQIRHVAFHAVKADELVILKTNEDKLTIGDIELPEGVELVGNDDGRKSTTDDDQSVTDLVVANVYNPGALAAANEAAGGDTEDESEVEAENGSKETSTDSESEDK